VPLRFPIPRASCPKIVGALRAEGFLCYSHENMILVAPPLIITPEQVREEMAKVDKVLSTL